MVISNLNIKLIEDRLGSINKAVARLKRLSYLDERDFLEDDNPAIAESYLRRSLEAVFDIGRHIIAKSADKGIVEYKEIASALGDRGVITKQLAERLRLMAGYRNRLVHFYHEVSDRELHLIAKNNLADIEGFVKEIKTFIESYRQKKS
jgi:uncharacterized protein YutE (UPF0331/DUF86 family)